VKLKIEVEGLDKLPDSAEVREALSKAMEDAAEKIRRRAIERTPVDTGYLKSAWTPLIKLGSGISFGNYAPYAGIVEYGLYPGLGPKTVEFRGRIYSSQAPGGMVGPVVRDREFISKLGDEVSENVKKALHD